MPFMSARSFSGYIRGRLWKVLIVTAVYTCKPSFEDFELPRSGGRQPQLISLNIQLNRESYIPKYSEFFGGDFQVGTLKGRLKRAPWPPSVPHYVAPRH